MIKTVTITSEAPEFPRFFLETNQFFDWIETVTELELALNTLLKYDYELDRIYSLPEYSGRAEFGTRREHTGTLTLLDWLSSNKINVRIKD